MKHQIYMAGPCFSTAEREWNKWVVTHARHIVGPEGIFDFWLPQENVTEAHPTDQIYMALMQGLVQSTALVACLDGTDGDSGTCWEMGFCAGLTAASVATAKPVMWYRTDFRRGGDTVMNVNLMMGHSAKQIPLPHLNSKAIMAHYVAERIVEDLGFLLSP